MVKKEHLARDAREYSVLALDGAYYLAATIAIQDIDAYSARDLGKTRDMQVGMLPPKLAQTMINLALGDTLPTEARVYDPFCGLGTVLIESIQMGASQVYGSDIEPAMTEATKKSVGEYLPVVASNAVAHIETLDARNITKFSRFSEVTHMVTEGYLGRVFTKGTMTSEAVKIEKSHLLDIYRNMFNALRESAFSGTIVMSIPCWEVPRDAIYFSEFFEVLRDTKFQSIPLIQGISTMKLTKYGTLVYRRPDQLVGREIVKIQRVK